MHVKCILHTYVRETSPFSRVKLQIFQLKMAQGGVLHPLPYTPLRRAWPFPSIRMKLSMKKLSNNKSIDTESLFNRYTFEPLYSGHAL